MAISSYIGNSGRGGGGWANSLLPSSTTTPTSKSKVPSRKSRKRTALINFLFTNFFTIALTVSLIFFLITIFLFGIPKPLSSPFKAPNPGITKPRKPIYRKPVLDPQKDGVVLGSVVDITTKDLYDNIKFKDDDGGAWKQGWKVSYKGDEAFTPIILIGASDEAVATLFP